MGIDDFLIVGVGASVEGVDSLEAFLNAVPRDSGLAFVVVLSPLPEIYLPGVLEHSSRIAVTQVEDTVRIEPNRVYTAPPHRVLSIADGHLISREPSDPEDRRAPIDTFLQVLADAAGTRAVSVILSGPGADGSVGTIRVKERGGICVAQDPEGARRADMPRRCVATGAVDYVLPDAGIPSALVAHARCTRTQAVAERSTDTPGTEYPARTRGERNSALLVEVQDYLTRLSTGGDVMETVGRRIREHLTLSRLSVCEIDVGLDQANCVFDQADGDRSGLGTRPLSAFLGEQAVAALTAGQTIAIDDVSSDPRTPGRADAYAPYVVGSQVLAPGLRNGQWRFMLAAGRRDPGPWRPDELDLVRDLAVRISLWFERAEGERKLRESEERLRRANDELEERVSTRTAQLAEINDALQIEVQERRAAEDRAKALLKRIVSVQEDERRRISRDLHDHLGQQTTALRLTLDLIKARGGHDAELREDVERAEMTAARLDADLDFLARELRPAALDDIGVKATLANYLQEWSRQYGIRAAFHTTGLDRRRLPPDVETNIYRVAQEALNNVYKHTKATCVDLILELRDGEVVLIVEDDGQGFDPAHVEAEHGEYKGLGLVGMRERAALIGGALQVESSRGHGTAVFMRVPV
jgi:signal transduction histidine kinase